MNIIINYYDNKNYNSHRYISFNARPLADNQLISKKYNITVGEFKKVFLDKTSSLRQKSKQINVAVTTLRNWAKRLGLESESDVNKAKNITKERFDEVYHLDIPEKEKYEMLGVTHKTYYKKLINLGYIAKRTAKKKENSAISRQAFEQVFFDSSLTEQEKHKKLKMDVHAYLNKAREFGLLTDKIENKERIASITKEEFDRIFFDKLLGIRHKLKMLGMDHSTFIKYAQKYGYKTKMQLRLEYLKSITKEQFDNLFYDKRLNQQEKQERLQIDSRLFRLFAVKFVHANEIADNMTITVQEFDKVFFDESLSTKEKIKKLNIRKDDYYYLIAKFGYKTERQKQSQYIYQISKEKFLEVADDIALSEDEKCKKLKISQKTFTKLAKKYGYKSERIKQIEHIKTLTKDEYDEIFFEDSLGEKEKHKRLEISPNTFRNKAKDYGYTTKTQKNIKKVADITKDEFDSVYKDNNLSGEEKCRKLNISMSTYQRLIVIFGYKK